MDTNKLKRFATEARNKIRQGVARKLLTLGFSAEGEPADFPRQLQGVTLYRGQQLEESFYEKWVALYEAIQRHGVSELCEEVAYTWFNRLIAIRILQKNGFIDRVLSFDNAAIRVPHIVSEARQGRIPAMDTAERLRLRAIINDPTKTYDQFSLLITAFCHATPILNRCFGSIDDYTSLLLPDDILDEGGFIDMLNRMSSESNDELAQSLPSREEGSPKGNNTPFISDDDFRTTELLGWLYQFYIAEKKDDVFASFKNGHKAEAEDIPAATQIFTPNWIVRYMVENTLGRIYLDNNPDADLQERMPYLVPKEDDANDEAVYTYDRLEDLRVIDPACGSGHILLEAFDLLFSMYQAEFYSRAEAVEAIFRHNLVGIDLDTRAKQLAQFALLLKACQKDAAFVDAHVMPRVMDMSRLMPPRYDILRDTLPHFFLGGSKEAIDEVVEAYKLMEDAETLGSIMKFIISPATRSLIVESMERWEREGRDDFEGLFAGMRLILALTDSYTAVIANPPYMGSGNMNTTLAQYVKRNYADGKSDLFSVFMLVAEQLLQPHGKYGMINMQSWMFLSSFEALRRRVLDEQRIDSMLHLGPHTFDELSGEVVQNTAFVITRLTDDDDASKSCGTYYRLVDAPNCEAKAVLYRSQTGGLATVNGTVTSDKPIVYKNIRQSDFEKIPGCPIGYWVSGRWSKIYVKEPLLEGKYEFKKGMSTGDNSRFIKLWHEVDNDNIIFDCCSKETSISSTKKWYPINCGGTYRKWYGNQNNVVNWLHDGKEMKANAVILNHGGHWSRYITSTDKFFREGLSWNAISSGNICVRHYGKGFLFCSASMCGFGENLNNVIALLNSVVGANILSILAPTLNYGPLQIKKIPLAQNIDNQIASLVQFNISLSRADWDSHETSWDFETNPLLSVDEDTYMANIDHYIEQHEKETGEHLCIDPAALQLGSLAWRVDQYKQKWEYLFRQLHENEEELNRQFIGIYGLEDELQPDVPLNEITILQQGEISIDGEQIVWHDNVLMKQLISYAVGCIMGRYSLDKSGLILANQGDTLAEFAAQVPNSRFTPDDDGIVPLMDEQSPFPDNVVARLQEWVKVAFGNEHQAENLNYIEAALGKSIKDYMAKDFWKDHKKTYQNRPIYWLFSSKKGAFQCLVYMHRMDAYTVGKVRMRYLLPYIEWLKGRIDVLMARQAEISTTERKQLRDYGKWLEECREYDIRLHEVANKQTAIDLDDGVVVNYAKYGDVLAKLK